MSPACTQLCANHLQHIKHLQPVRCHVVQRGSSAIKFYRVEIALILVLFYGLKQLIDKGAGIAVGSVFGSLSHVMQHHRFNPPLGLW